jgi:hypothetical protein
LVANFANVRSIRGRVMNLMVSSEHFLYLMLLVLAGAYWQLPSGWAIILTAAYVVARISGKVVGGFLTTRRLARQHPVPRLVGLGLTSQGGMALAIIIEFRLLVDHPLAAVVVGVGVAAVLVNELAAPWLALAVADRAAEEAV